MNSGSTTEGLVGAALSTMVGGKMAEAVRLYYWHGLSMREVGRRLDLSESRVSQMHSAAIELLREQTFARRAVAS